MDGEKKEQVEHKAPGDSRALATAEIESLIGIGILNEGFVRAPRQFAQMSRASYLALAIVAPLAIEVAFKLRKGAHAHLSRYYPLSSFLTGGFDATWSDRINEDRVGSMVLMLLVVREGATNDLRGALSHVRTRALSVPPQESKAKE